VIAYRLGPGPGSAPGRAAMKISGTFTKFDWSSEISIPRPYPAAIALRGSAELGGAQSRLMVAALEGEFEKQPVKLQAPFTAAFGEGGWRVSAIDLGLAGGRLGFSAAMEGDVLDARGKLEGFPLRLAALFEPRAAVDGTASGTFSLTGPLANPTLSAALDARDIRPEGSAKDAFPALTASLRLDQEGDGTRAEAQIKGPEATAVTASLATGPLLGSHAAPAEAPIAGEVKANVRLAFIAELIGLGEDRVSGDLDGTLKVSGTLARPRLQGEARLGGGSYEGARTGTILREIEALARFDGDEVRLVSLTAGDGEAGRLSAKGAVRITDGAGAQEGLKLTLERFTGLRHPSADIQATGTVRLTGPLAAPRIAGKLRIERGEITIPDRLAEDIVELDVVEVNAPTGQAERSEPEDDPSLGKALAIALDVAIDVPGKTFVRGRGLDSEWKGGLAITGTTAAPVIKGRLQAVRGTFAFAGKTFVVKQGAVSFPPGGGAEPEIAAMAEAKLTDITARIEISGTVSKPEIAVSSDPPLPQEEVLAQILFGRTAGQLTAVQAAQLVQTAATLSGRGGGPGIVDRIRSTLGVDVLNVESGEGGEGGASLKAGNYLTEDVFLSVTQGTQPGSQKVGVEVKVTPHVSVESNISGNADSNIGVNWKWDY
jgi:translocation and assembly module TamB